MSEVADLRLGDSGGGSWVRVTTGAAAGAAAAAGTAGTFDFLRLGMPTPTFRGMQRCSPCEMMGFGFGW